MKSLGFSRFAATARRLPLRRRRPGRRACAAARNPRTDAQCILARHQLIRLVAGAEFDELMREEWEFCAEAGRTLRWYAQQRRPDAAAAIAHWEDTYERTWAAALADRPVAGRERPTVLTVDDGPADLYALAAYGLAPLLRLTRVDAAAVPAPAVAGRYDAVLVAATGVPRRLDRTAALARRRLVVSLAEVSDRTAGNLARRLPGRVTAHHIRSFLRDEYKFGYWPAEHAWTLVAETDH